MYKDHFYPMIMQSAMARLANKSKKKVFSYSPIQRIKAYIHASLDQMGDEMLTNWLKHKTESNIIMLVGFAKNTEQSKWMLRFTSKAIDELHSWETLEFSS